MFIKWLKMMLMIVLCMKAIHMKTKEDGGNAYQEVGEGSLGASTKISIDQVA
jgi:hypothetical protein